MGAFGIWQWIIVLGVVVLLFARPGKISGLMGDFGKGLRSFKTGMKDDDADGGGDGDGGGDAVKVIAEEAAPAAPKKAAKKRRAKKASKKAPLKRKTAKKKSAKKKTAKKKTKAKA